MAQGEFPGIGIVVNQESKKPENAYLVVIATQPGGPADKAGLKANDHIVQINEKTLQGLKLDEVISLLKGKRGSKVTVKVQRKNYPELLTFEIIRDMVKEQNAMCYYFKDQDIYYLALNMFTTNAIKQLEKLLTKSHRKPPKGLILDLRNNSGGLITSVRDIAGLFVPKGSLLVTTKDRNKKTTASFSTSREPITTKKVPIFILINNYTASAAEILAGVLKYYSDKQQDQLVFLIGTTTWGKGSVQEVIPIGQNCALKLTVALYYLPDDKTIQGEGIKPDFELQPRFAPTKDMMWFTQTFGHEHTLKNAISSEDKKKVAQKTPEKKKTWQEERQEHIGSDYLILSTVRLIEMLDMAKKAYPKQVNSRQKAINFLHKHYSFNDSISMEEIKI